MAARGPPSQQASGSQAYSLGDGRRFSNLRSVKLQNCINMADLASLQQLPDLEHLSLDIYPKGDMETRLINSLPRLKMHKLKSLVIVSSSLSGSLLEAAVGAWPQLEHLACKYFVITLLTHWQRASEREAAALKLLGARLKHLRSLEITGLKWPTQAWAWLEEIVEKGQLEYLNLDTTLPVHMLYQAIRNCPVSGASLGALISGRPGFHTGVKLQKLRVIRVSGKYSPAKITAAALEAGASGEGKLLPVLYCKVQADWWKVEREKKRRSRVVFLDQSFPRTSHVCRQYLYGCLSEGEPKWK